MIYELSIIELGNREVRNLFEVCLTEEEAKNKITSIADSYLPIVITTTQGDHYYFPSEVLKNSFISLKKK